MTGVVLLLLALLVVIPVGTLLLGALVAALLGGSLRRDGEARHDGSPLIDLNR